MSDGPSQRVGGRSLLTPETLRPCRCTEETGRMRFETRPLTPATWADLEELFGLPGGSIVRGCWCMYYRKTGQVSVSAAAGVTNKEQLCSLVDAGVVPGLVG